MTEMQLGLQHDPDLEPKRAKTLFISICFHVALLIFLVLNPNLLVETPKRTIRIAGQDFDMSKLEMTQLTMPPMPNRPKPPAQAQPTPPPQQQQPQPQAAPPPPPPPPPPPKESPAITPDMTLAPGAKLDGTPKASRGNTPEIKAGNAGTPDAGKPPAPKPEISKEPTPQMAQNTNPNALRIPDLLNQAGKIVHDSMQPSQRGTAGPGQRTGLPGAQVQENPDFSTEEPTILSPTYGYDFGPYLNQVLSRIRSNWYALIPDIAKYKKGRVVIIFTIEKNGNIVGTRIAAPSGTDPLDRAAYGGINASNPFTRIPADFVGDHIDLQITFLYNINPR